MSIEQDIPLASLVLPLDAADATLERVGGKGASLARMSAAGLPVPPGFHITTVAYQHFVEANQLQEAILTAVAAANPDVPATLEEASQGITALFAQGAIPADIAQAISQAYAQLGDGELAVAVRSSATAEDLPEMSFAGQQESYLNVRGKAMVLDAVKRCWASLWTARAIGYRARNKIAPQDVSLAVVVQQLVAADASGVLFTAHPLTGNRDQVMINAAWGLGEAIVSGQVTPDSIVVDKTSGAIVSMEIADKAVMSVRTAEGTREETVPAARRTIAVLTPAQTATLARLGVQIEQLYGQPMDIEWAMQHEQIFVVQARPITTLPKTTAATAAASLEWKLPKPKGKYMRASVIELLPDPLTPLFETLGLPIWNRAMDGLMKEIGMSHLFDFDLLTTINDYAYYDMSFSFRQSLQLTLLVPGLVPLYSRLMRTARQRWEKAHAEYQATVKRWEGTDRHELKAVALLEGAREINTAAADYYLSIQSGILPAAYMSETAFTMFYNRLIKRRSDPLALTFLLGFDSEPIQAEKSLYDLAAWARKQPGLAEILDGISGEQFITAYEVGHIEGVDDAIWSKFRQRFADHLARFGHTIYDLDFAKPLPADDPVLLLETLKFFLSKDATDPYVRQTSSAAAREQAVQRIERRLSGLNGLFRLRLSWFRSLLQKAQRFAPLRENALADTGLGWPVLRRMLHEIGQRLVSAGSMESNDDIFWLTLDELEAAARNLDNGQPVEQYQTTIAERRARWESQRRMTPPVALPLKGGARFMGIDFSSTLPAHTDQKAGNTIKGIGASPGRITGVARVIHGPEEFAQMRPGDILVARITTPAWTPLFALASGIVTDVGGPLSHSSIVAREYRIPAVLGTGVATERLSSGQRITVDGDSGTVTAI